MENDARSSTAVRDAASPFSGRKEERREGAREGVMSGVERGAKKTRKDDERGRARGRAREEERTRTRADDRDRERGRERIGEGKIPRTIRVGGRSGFSGAEDDTEARSSSYQQLG